MDTKQGITNEKRKEFTYQEHIPVSYSYKIVSIDPDFTHKQKLYKGENVVQHFLNSLQNETHDIFKKYITNPKPLILSD